jgi:hypothetical protein
MEDGRASGLADHERGVARSGSRSMMAKHILVVLSNAQDGTDEPFNRWYTETHLGDILTLPGYAAAQRFKRSETQLAIDDLPYRYLAIYEVDAEDVASAADALRATSGHMVIDPALDRSRTVAWFYTPITERVEA